MPKNIFNKLSIFIAISIVTFNLSAEMPGMSGEIRRDYSDTSFGRVHLWTIGEGPALLLLHQSCLLYTSPSPRDRTRSRMPSSA